MPLTDMQIEAWAKQGNITPYDFTCLNPASIDMRVGNLWRDFENPADLITSNTMTIYARSLRVDLWNMLARILPIKRKPTAVLAITYEQICIPPDMCAEVKLKTTPTREGLGHPLADWVDPGYAGHLTLMLHAFKDIRLTCGERVCQLVLYRLDENVFNPYSFNGHYMNQDNPTVSWRKK